MLMNFISKIINYYYIIIVIFLIINNLKPLFRLLLLIKSIK